MKPVLLDTGVIVALLDRSERRHRECVEVVERIERPLVTCEAVIAESCYLLRGLKAAAEAVLANVERRVFEVPFRAAEAAGAIARTMRKYADVPADFADACLITMADALGTGEILTLDDDFRVYRWRKRERFTLLP